MRVKVLPFRRRREALTNYKKRLALVKGGLDRVVLRRTNKRVIAELVKYEQGDKVLLYTDSTYLKKYGWPSRCNRPTAYLTGLLFAKSAQKKSAGSECVLDIGLSSSVKGSLPFAFAKGCVDGGLGLKSGAEIDEKTYNYSDATYAKKLKEDGEEAYKKQYGRYIKDGINVESLGVLFKEVKEKIMKD